MIFKLIFFVGFVGVLLRLVQRERLSLDLASLTFVLIASILALSFSPYFVERIAALLEFSNPAMSVIAMVLVGLLVLCLILAVSVSDLRRRQSLLIRQLAQLQHRLTPAEHLAPVRGESARPPASQGRSSGASARNEGPQD